MTNPHPVVTSFPKRCDIQHASTPVTCSFQAQAELQALMLQRLLNMLARLGGTSHAPVQLGELCQHARELLNDMVLCYRSALALAERGECHD